MNGQLAFVLIILALSSILAVGIALFIWGRRRAGLWAYPFLLAALVAAWWSFFYALELSTFGLEQKIVWAKVEYLGIVLIAPLWFLFAMGYTNETHWLKRSRALPLFIVPAITFLLVLTNESHHLIWQTTALETTGAFPSLDVSYGAWFWIYSAYSYILLAAATIALLLFVRRSPRTYRWQNIALILGAFFPWIANFIYLSKLGPLSNIDFSPVAFVASALVILWSIFRFQLFDVTPIARKVTVDTMQDGVIVLDVQNRIVDINNAALRMADLQDVNVIGQSIADLLSDWPDLLDTYKDVVSAEAVIQLETQEGMRYFELNISPLTNFRQQVNGRLILFHDITTYKNTQAELVLARDEALEANRLKTELLSRISHELRTPLNVILGYTEMIQEGVLGVINEKQYDAMNKVLVGTRFLTQQVNDLLDFSSIEAGRANLYYSFFPISEVLTEVVGNASDSAAEKSLNLTGEIAADVPELVYGDRERVTQILNNLVDNAIKFSLKGTIQIDIYLENAHYWVMQVSDEGPGIPLQAQSLIFEPFRQLDGSMTRIHGGTGLGLALVKQFAELMGGEVRLKSDVGQGSSFIILLPNKASLNDT